MELKKDNPRRKLTRSNVLKLASWLLARDKEFAKSRMPYKTATALASLHLGVEISTATLTNLHKDLEEYPKLQWKPGKGGGARRGHRLANEGDLAVVVDALVELQERLGEPLSAGLKALSNNLRRHVEEGN